MTKNPTFLLESLVSPFLFHPHSLLWWHLKIKWLTWVVLVEWGVKTFFQWWSVGECAFSATIQYSSCNISSINWVHFILREMCKREGEIRGPRAMRWSGGVWQAVRDFSRGRDFFESALGFRAGVSQGVRQWNREKTKKGQYESTSTSNFSLTWKIARKLWKSGVTILRDWGLCLQQSCSQLNCRSAAGESHQHQRCGGREQPQWERNKEMEIQQIPTPPNRHPLAAYLAYSIWVCRIEVPKKTLVQNEFPQIWA